MVNPLRLAYFRWRQGGLILTQIHDGGNQATAKRLIYTASAFSVRRFRLQLLDVRLE